MLKLFLRIDILCPKKILQSEEGGNFSPSESCSVQGYTQNHLNGK